MIIRLIKRTKIYNFHLPTTVQGNYWITDLDNLGNVRNLVNVEEDDGAWRLKSNFETKIVFSSLFFYVILDIGFWIQSSCD